MNTNPLVVVRSVAKSYKRGRNKIDAIREVSLDVREGELVVLTGRSGSGKTTLLNLIAALDHPDAGEISRRSFIADMGRPGSIGLSAPWWFSWSGQRSRLTDHRPERQHLRAQKLVVGAGDDVGLVELA